MREEIQKFHTLVLATYQAQMFETLIFSHNIVTTGVRAFQFEDKEELELPTLLRGFLAMKDIDGRKTKYFLEEEYYSELPIRVNDYEEILLKDGSKSKSVILRPTDITPFRIKAEKCWDNDKEFVDCIAAFKHSQPDQWTLNKLIAIISYVGKITVGICSSPEFGKSSIYNTLHGITQKCPVFRPRSVPGVLAQITSDGNMIFDDIHAVLSEVKKIIEAFSFCVGGNDPIYINGALKSKHTKPKYDISKQSVTFLYNLYSNYSNPEKQFWDNIWLGKDALKTRFLCLKLDGKLEEEFDKNFNVTKVADENKMFYIKIAKHLLYLKDIKFNNTYQRRYVNGSPLHLQGRHKILYEEITWMIDVYSDSKEEYDKFIGLLNKAIQDYEQMIQFTPPVINQGTPQQELVVEEENVKEQPELVEMRDHLVEKFNEAVIPEKKVFEVIDKAVDGKILVETLLEEAKVPEELIKKMLTKGSIFEVTPGIIARL